MLDRKLKKQIYSTKILLLSFFTVTTEVLFEETAFRGHQDRKRMTLISNLTEEG
jgi:hypothetical protein